ncbi:hypothetical protein D3C75_477640 [compost metagenome]
MFVVEYRVYGGQADVFVTATVAGDEVTVEQFVIVSACFGRPVDGTIGVGGQNFCGAVSEGYELRHRRVGDIIEEGMTGAQRV